MSNIAFAEAVECGVRVHVRLTPSGRRDGVDGVMTDAQGRLVLKASVTQAPEDGKANKALIKMLAKEWKLAKSALDIVQGQTSRNKVLRVSGNTAELLQTLDVWAAQRGLK